MASNRITGYPIEMAYNVRATMPNPGGLVDLEVGGYAIPLLASKKVAPPSKTIPILARIPTGIVSLLPGNTFGLWRIVDTLTSHAPTGAARRRSRKQTRSHSTKRSLASASQGRFWISPAADPRDRYAAGYEENHFQTRREAQRAIASLRKLGGDFDVSWVINED